MRSFSLLIAMLVQAAPVGAEIYQWRDEQGQLHFSDKAPPAGVAVEEKTLQTNQGLRFAPAEAVERYQRELRNAEARRAKAERQAATAQRERREQQQLDRERAADEQQASADEQARRAALLARKRKKKTTQD